MSRIEDGFYAFDNDLNSVLAALEGTFVESGGAVAEHGTPQMKVVMGAVQYYINDISVYKVETEVTITAADGSQPRKDIIVGDSSGNITAVAGTKAVAKPSGSTGPQTYDPKPVDIPANKVLLAEVWVEAAETTILDADITDRRIFREVEALDKDIFIPADAFRSHVGSPSLGNVGLYPCWAMDDSSLEEVTATYLVPKTWAAVKVYWVWAMDQVQTGKSGRLGHRWLQVSSASGLITDTPTTYMDTISVPNTAKRIKLAAGLGSSISVTKDWLLSITFRRDGTSGQDTAVGDLLFLGILLRF